VQGDKQDTLQSLAYSVKVEDVPTFGTAHDGWLETSSGLYEMMELEEIEEVKAEAVPEADDHQALIDEVERFLEQHEVQDPAALRDQVRLFFWGGVSAAPCASPPPPRLSIFQIILFLLTTLLTGMTGITLHML
jgi:hypothetical protein